MAHTLCRIRFLLPRDRRLNADVRRLSITHDQLPVAFELVALDSDVISKSANLVVRSAALPDPELAHLIGGRAQTALLIAAAQIRLGIDLGRSGAKGRFLDSGLDMVKAAAGVPEDTVVVNDEMGLSLIDASAKTVFAGLNGVQAIVGTPVDRFSAAFVEGFQLAPSVTERTALALELFSASRFEASLRARFLTLVSAMECIAERAARADDALALVRSFRSQLKTAVLNETDHSQLTGALRDLEHRSIGGTCKEFVSKYLGAEPAAFFKRCYNARSELVHTGHTDFDLGANTIELEDIVAETIVRLISHVA